MGRMGEEWGQPVVDDATVGAGQYSVIAKLGQGGMAGVYLAVARGPVSDFHKLVVLKRLHESLREDAGFVRMFVREAKIAARLNHPNVVHTYSVDIEDGRPVIVMEYLDGVSLSALKKRLQGRGLAERLPILGAIAQALGGLHYVHELADYDGQPMGLIHRDMKPANLFITFDGQVKVLDFGIAKATAPGQENTNSRVLKGTARYMAPEAVGGGSIDRRADIFSTGVMLWEAASGQRLWEGDEELKIIRRLMDNDVPGLDSVDPETPPELTAMCTKALQLAPDERQQTAAELRSELLAFLHDQGLADIEGSLRAVMEAEFSERRELRAATIRERLAESVHAQAVSDDVRTLPSGAISSASGTADPISAPSATSQGAQRAQPPSRRWPALFAVGALSMALGGVGLYLWVSAADPEPEPALEVQQAPASTPEVEPEDMPEHTPDPKAEPTSVLEAEPDPVPEIGLEPEVEPEPTNPPPTRRASKRRRAAKAAPTPEATATPPADAPLKPGEMPTKKTKKKSGLSLDKDSPWGGQP